MSEPLAAHIGDRIEYDPADFGVTLPPVPPDVRERWGDARHDWEIAIGEGGIYIMNGPMLELPATYYDEPVYSNLNHKLDDDVVQRLTDQPGGLYAQHAAYDFCGYVWLLPDGRWVDQVWRYGAPVEDIVDGSAEAVIERANESYGVA